MTVKTEPIHANPFRGGRNGKRAGKGGRGGGGGRRGGRGEGGNRRGGGGGGWWLTRLYEGQLCTNSA